MNALRNHCAQILRYNFCSTSGGLRTSSYSSSLSLRNIYPNSNLSITTPSKVEKPPNEEFSGFIPIDQLQITYSRSSGPGGQNVNVVNTKVDLRFHVESATWINNKLKTKLMQEHKTVITKDGFFVIRSEKTRSQQLNLADAMERLRNIIWKISAPEPSITPETEEKLRQRKEKAIRLRLSEKRMHSQKKRDRASPVINF